MHAGDGRFSGRDGVEGSTAGSALSGLSERVAGFTGAELEAGPLRKGGFRLRVSLPLQPDGVHQDERR